jgi:ABC-2 type transport system ATP-binding protein
MLEVRDLTKRYGDLLAIDHLTFSVQGGEVVGFLGANGAGKTTTLRILSCFMTATSGQAKVAGFDCFRQSLDVRRSIGYLPENVPLYGELRVDEYLHFRAKIKGVPRASRNTEVARVIGRCKLEERAKQLVGTLSRGFRQRVGLADALLGPPKILLLDEPTSGLDPVQRLEVRTLLKELKQDHTVLLSTHILSEAEASCSRSIILHQGKLVPESEIARVRGQKTFELSFAGPVETVRAALRALPGVASVRELEPVREDAEESGAQAVARAAIVPQEAQDPRPALLELFSAKHAEGWALLELRRRVPTLEEIFSATTTGAPEGGSKPEGDA